MEGGCRRPAYDMFIPEHLNPQHSTYQHNDQRQPAQNQPKYYVPFHKWLTVGLISCDFIWEGRKEAADAAHTTCSFQNTAIRNILRINTTTGDDRRLPPAVASAVLSRSTCDTVAGIAEFCPTITVWTIESVPRWT